MPLHILIIGGYGRAGMEIARLLLIHTESIVTLAGRTLAKAEAAAASLDSDRIKAAEVDITHQASVQQAFKHCDLVIVCVPYKGNTAEIVIKAVLNAGIDYIDINADPAKHRVFEKLADHIAQETSVFLTEAGIIPGCPSAMLRYAHTADASMTQTRLGAVILDDNMSAGSVRDMLAHAGRSTRVYRAGVWQKASLLALNRLNFGEQFGTRFCVPVDLPETRVLVDQMPIDHLTVYQSGLNPIVNAIFLIWGLSGLTHTDRGLRLGVKLFLWANRNFTPSPHGVQVTLWTKDDYLSLFHEDVYIGTAIPVVAAIQQIIRNDLPRPAHGFMGHIVNPAQLLVDLMQMNMTIETTLSVPAEENTL